jgi:predicted membrane-bound dolichyl-phosphate-mannose-protein mannosyltransferase
VGRLNALAISGSVPAAPAPLDSLRVIAMLDVVLLAIGVGFFVASVLYVLACERM